MPIFSVIIAVYNAWAALDTCLQSLSQQMAVPEFEVIVVDDGSDETTPDNIGEWACRIPLTLVRASHAGVSAARNRGMQTSRGSIFLFVDADCRLDADCLRILKSIVDVSPQHGCFQLHLLGDGRGLAGRSEALRLITLQDHLIQPDGRIRYLNTAGFAIRRERVNVAEGLFDPNAIRAEDTLLLACLMKRGELPFFVASAFVTHIISNSVSRCLRKEARSAYLEKSGYDIIDSKGLRIRVKHGERLSMLSSMWRTSNQHSIERAAWFMLAARQFVRMTTRLLTNLLEIRPASPVQPTRTEV